MRRSGPRARRQDWRRFARRSVQQASRQPIKPIFLSGERETARLILRDLVNATLGFERLAKVTAMPSKSLHRMLSPKGNPSMDNLAAIFDAVRKRLNVKFKAHTVNLQKVA
jgi:DNA-binding phage protein